MNLPVPAAATAATTTARRCRALLLSAPASGQGKTSVTAALARHHRRQGLRVRVFKTGPDFLDPMVLARACGAPVQQLDLFMGGLAHCRELLWQAAAEADLILVEGVMGLYDGQPSSADLAQAFGLPLLLVIDASAMAQTFAALAFGLARHRPGLQVAGVVANRVGSAAHGAMVGQGLPADLPLLAALPRQPDLSLPERHLGLVQAAELPQIEGVLDRWADAWAAAVLPDWQAPKVAFLPPEAPSAPAAVPRLLAGKRIGIAFDAAFAFIYPANLDTLQALGAELCFFSPLRGELPREVDALWLPGGYPELHAQTLSAQHGLATALHRHQAAGKPMLAECGGLLCLLQGLTTREGRRFAMAGVLPGEAQMMPRLQALGLQRTQWPQGELRGHSFHHSRLETPLKPLMHGQAPHEGHTAEAVYRLGRTTASYIHHYFPSNPLAVAALFGAEALPPGA